MTNKRHPAGYQVCIHVGPPPDGLEPSVRFVDVTPSGDGPEAVLAAIERSGLTPADFRSEAVCSIEAGSYAAVLSYAAILGFAQRRVDVVAEGRLLQAAAVDKMARTVVDAGKPDPVPAQIQVGAVAHPDMPSVLFAARVEPDQASQIRFARRVRFAPAGSTSEALGQFLVVAGIRARGTVDRFPFLVNGDEPAPAPETPFEVAGVCLDTLRGAAAGLRRAHRTGDRRTIVPRPADSPRRDLLNRAANVPIEDALVLLGGRQNPDTGLWHCPRPERHTNGDANASMRTVKGLVRCYRCDGERVDSLRLAMDVLGASPDAAARWLVTGYAQHVEAQLTDLFD